MNRHGAIFTQEGERTTLWFFNALDGVSMVGGGGQIASRILSLSKDTLVRLTDL